MLLLFFLSFLNFFVFVNGDCPFGTIPTFKDKTLCYSFNSTSTDFLSAEEQCNSLGGHLASVHAPIDNMFLNQQAANRFISSDASEFWLGVNDLFIVGNWTWMDNTPFDYKDWDINQPQNITGEDCGVMILKSGKWIAEDCSKHKPFVCLVNALPSTTTVKPTLPPPTTMKPKNCPTNWVYFPGSGYCYGVYYNQNWANAETFCTSFSGGHLASIHNADENLFVSKLIGSTLSTGENGESWIGAHTEDSEAHWMWTDGTPFDYVYWESGQPDGPGFENCLVFWGSSYGIATFWDARCELIVARFVCKKLPS